MKALFWADGAVGAGKFNFLFLGTVLLAFSPPMAVRKSLNQCVLKYFLIYFTTFCLEIQLKEGLCLCKIYQFWKFLLIFSKKYDINNNVVKNLRFQRCGTFMSS